MLDSLKSSNKTVGVKQSSKAIESGLAKLAFIAKDADERIIFKLKELCQKNSVEIIYIDNMKQLGKACSIEVGSAVACILK